MSAIIKVENLSKQYRLGTVGTGTIKDDLKRSWYRLRGKEDPFLKIGETNDRSSKGTSEYVWALKDISFEVQPGEVLGIIGRNGAGKSTLLKILSRVAEPSTGRVTMNGRVASLLEVGTGMHPDLTGRENIYLNGTILGMRKREIDRKFDEIVDFAGVERYIDTPVKRYSSGMHVRLGFAVAAYLEPEILIVDEVLAVGDLEFQRKCIGKMQEVSSKQGRTVLFVSHNLEAILGLCNKCILLEMGALVSQGIPTEVVEEYSNSNNNQAHTGNLAEMARIHRDIVHLNANFVAVSLANSKIDTWKIDYGTALELIVQIYSKRPFSYLEIGVAVKTMTDIEVITSLSSDAISIVCEQPGFMSVKYRLENLRLVPGRYLVSLGLRSEFGTEDYLPDLFQIEIQQTAESARLKSHTRRGIVIPDVEIIVEKIN